MTVSPIFGRSSAVTLCISAHCSPCAPGGVSQRICQSPCTDLTAPWALARSAVLATTTKTEAANSTAANLRIVRPLFLCAIMDSLGPRPSRPRQAAAPCLQGEPVVSRTIKVKPLWPRQGRGKSSNPFVAAACHNRIWASSRLAHAMMSALQQSSICGLEEPEFPCRGEACQRHRAAGQSSPKRVASHRGGSRRKQGFRSSPMAAIKISTRE